MKNRITFFCIIFCVLFFCIACGSNTSEKSFAMSERTMNQASMMDFSENALEESLAQGTNSGIDRKLVYTGYIDVQVKNLTDAENTIMTWVKNWSGYISASESYYNQINITIRIPVKSFQDAVEKSKELGKINKRSITSDDVTEKYYDLSTRLETRKILRTRLQNYLSTAEDIKSLISVEKELNDVQMDIESMEGQFKRLSNQIEFATLEIRASLPDNVIDSGFVYPDMAQKFRDLWSNIVEFFASLLFVIFYIIVFGIPIIGIVALFYWLLLGKIGLLRKLFSKLSNKNK